MDPIFIKAKIQSRHVNKTRYHVYIVRERNGKEKDAITENITAHVRMVHVL